MSEPFTAPGSDPPWPGSRAITIEFEEREVAEEDDERVRSGAPLVWLSPSDSSIASSRLSSSVICPLSSIE